MERNWFGEHFADNRQNGRRTRHRPLGLDLKVKAKKDGKGSGQTRYLTIIITKVLFRKKTCPIIMI